MVLADDDPDKWDYPEHTAAKHDIMARYLDAWFPILSTKHGRVLILDGFAGRGRYEDGSLGSPIIALERLLKHNYWPRMAHREFVFFFVEHNESNVESLRAALSEYREEYEATVGPWPVNVKYTVAHGTFEDHATEVIEYLTEQKRRMAPTFAFVDPFGWTGLPMALLAQLLDHPSCELFVNFMVGNVNRFITHPQQGNNMNELFGLDVNEVLADYDGSGSRLEHLRDVYISQLQDVARFDHVRWFEMVNSTGNIGYYLLHGTRDPLGVEKMKDAMWKTDPSGNYSFSDRLADENILFEPEPDLGPLRRAVLDEFAGRGPIVVNPDLQRWVILDTPYRKPHLRTVLRDLEKNGLINVERGGRQQFAPGVTVEVLPG